MRTCDTKPWVRPVDFRVDQLMSRATRGLETEQADESLKIAAERIHGRELTRRNLTKRTTTLMECEST